MGFRTVRTAVIRFTCERCADGVDEEQPPMNSDAPSEGASRIQRDGTAWPKGWSEVAVKTADRIGSIYTLLCARCTATLTGYGFLRCEDAPDDDGPDSVPEGAEGRGPGWSVRQGDEAPPPVARIAVTIIGAPGAGGGASGGGAAGTAGTGGFEYTTGRGGGAADPGGGTTRGAGGPMFLRRRSDACKRCAHTLEQHEAPGSECVIADCGCRWFVDAFEAVQ